MNNTIKAKLEESPAVGVLAQLEGGVLLSELNEALKGATSACLQNGGKATITLKLTVTGNPHMDGQRVEVKPELKVTQPSPKRISSLFFVNDEGDLSRNPPKQEVFFDDDKPVKAAVPVHPAFVKKPGDERPEGSAHSEASRHPHSA